MFLNAWLELEKLFVILQQENLYTTPQQCVIFEEDIFFMGFTPLAAIISKTKSDAPSEESLQLKYRLKVINDFGEIYKANQQRLELLENTHFINEDLNSDIKQALDDLQNTQTTTKTNEPDDVDDIENEDCDEDAENIIVNGDIDKLAKAMPSKLTLKSKGEDYQLSQLSKLKKELEAKTHVKKMYHNKLEVI